MLESSLPTEAPDTDGQELAETQDQLLAKIQAEVLAYQTIAGSAYRRGRLGSESNSIH